MNEFKVNEYITLKLEGNETYIYVKGERFRQCMRVVLQIPLDDIKKYDSINSIDEAVDITKHLYQNKIVEGLAATPAKKQDHSITYEQEFWGHCSNLQSWTENDYDTRLLHSNLAFPLLKKLTEVGDPIAKKVFKEEVIKRWDDGYVSTRLYLLFENYFDFLDKNDIKDKEIVEIFMNYINTKDSLGTDEFDYLMEIIRKDYPSALENEKELISNAIKKKIQDALLEKNIEIITHIHYNSLFNQLNKKDLISVFNLDEINLVKFVMENIDGLHIEVYDERDMLFNNINKIDDEVARYIGESFLDALPNYTYKKYYDPLFKLGLLEYLSKEHLIRLFTNPNINHIEFFSNLLKVWDNPDYTIRYTKELLKKKDLSFKDVVYSAFQKKNENVYIKFLEESYLWELFERDDLIEILDDDKLNFFENFSLTIHERAINGNGSREIYIPKVIPKEKLEEIIKQKNMTTFIPLLVMEGSLSHFFNEDELYLMIEDEHINLIKLVLTARDKLNGELASLNSDAAYEYYYQFFKMIKKRIDNDTILRILPTLTDVDLFPLMDNHIIEMLDYEDIIPLFKDKRFNRSFQNSLAKYIRFLWDQGLIDEGRDCTYFDKLISHLAEKHLDIFEVEELEEYLEIDPVVLLKHKTFEKLGIIDTLKLFEIADDEFLKKFCEVIKNLVFFSREMVKRDYFPESISFLHVVGKYLTTSLKKKILSILKKVPRRDTSPNRVINAQNYKVIYTLFYLRWILFFNKAELKEISLKYNVQRLSFFTHEHIFFLVYYYWFIDKEAVLRIFHQTFEYIRKNKANYSFLGNSNDLLRILYELNNHSKIIRRIYYHTSFRKDKKVSQPVSPINQYFRLAYQELKLAISNYFLFPKEKKNGNEEEKLDKKQFFNKSIIVHDNAEKPCYFMTGCPYGSLIECFKPIRANEISSCMDFGRECPVFYISEFVNENLKEEPPKDPNLERLNDNITKYDWFNDKKITVPDSVEKPCHKLKWCPYGSLGKNFKIRKITNKFECRIFEHDCPVFYHYEYGFG